ncbi:hypothetical protein Y032_0021g441 [Ancylostoma ceylanicum]|uniref:Uncharacterized protein n=1 Tax=Ancylostoma ceylanicum TaxID=53326 RepID=A0A016V037_9BILA|nr:hypothetical protein Y032_0021g441 [Ancylostoma ceylanicum]
MRNILSSCFISSCSEKIIIAGGKTPQLYIRSRWFLSTLLSNIIHQIRCVTKRNHVKAPGQVYTQEKQMVMHFYEEIHWLAEYAQHICVHPTG